MNDNYQCLCGKGLGVLKGHWWHYPNPLICPDCGLDNSERFKEWMINEMVNRSKPKKRQVK
jgi:hypothetical protein